MTRQVAALAGATAMWVAAVAFVGTSSLGAQAKPSDARTADHMKEHFLKVHEVEAAVIRGDLEGVKAPAQWLAAHEASRELDKASASQVASMRQAARQAADASDIKTAANATAAMLAACGDCHRAAAVVPALTPPERPAVGGSVGHMMEHMRAVEMMANGLIIPSATQWKQGADALKAAPLRSGDLPRDQKLTREIAASEDRVHVLADQAASATEEKARITTYAQIIATCARCHGLHGRIWGPGVKTGTK